MIFPVPNLFAHFKKHELICCFVGVCPFGKSTDFNRKVFFDILKFFILFALSLVQVAKSEKVRKKSPSNQ